MSERKVLNKYFPPDFDPSKIPRRKGGRNTTFTIRLMAPCNMRCITCGEYIYKGRKFNARKEDVDNMNHLGLRIYRFYIKCTACLSEISFRTDPANTDYVLEAGATRNFEALSKAEKLAEEEEKAYQEELKTNPMKLLEERTEQSKNEMARMEALEELQELNKREVKVNYDDMLSSYDKIREVEAAKEEEEDEDFVRQIFGRDGNTKIKRLIDDQDQDSDEEKKPRPSVKMFKRDEKATDLLAQAQPVLKKESWDKSIGVINAKKSSSLVLVKKKTTPQSAAPEKSSAPVTSASNSSSLGSLGLLGSYSDSDENSDS